MTAVQRTFAVGKGLDEVVAYLRDFSRAEAWDPGTKSCEQTTPGPVAVGTVWHNVSEFKGRQTELSYTLVTDEPAHLVFRGENTTVTSTDDMTFTATSGATEITYRATLDWHGIAKLAAPFVRGAFDKLADETESRMIRVINAL